MRGGGLTVLIFIKAFSFGIVIITSCTYTGQVNWTFGRSLYFTLDILTGNRTLYPDKVTGDEAIFFHSQVTHNLSRPFHFQRDDGTLKVHRQKGSLAQIK